MKALIAQARRRLFINDLLSQGSYALSAALLALIFLLLAGTQVLDWRWLLLIPLTAAAAGLFWAVRRVPGAYGTAQIIDHRMGLSDSLSTAVHFSDGNRRARVSDEFCESQSKRAEGLAETVDVRAAVPFTMPRALYLLAALFLVASSLFALRYGLSHRLDLRPPLARMLQQRFGGGEPTRQAKAKRRTPRPFTDPLDDAALLAVDQDSQSEMPESFRQENGRSEGEPEARKGSGEGARKENPEQSGDESKEGDEDADSDSRTPDEDGDDSTPPPEGNNNSDQRRQAPPNPEAASLLAKLQEAMQNMLSKLGLQPETGGFEEKFAAKQRGNKNGKGEQGSGKQQQSGKKGQQSDQAGEPQDGEGQPGDQSKQGEQADAKATGKGDSQQQGTKQPGSGIGSQDGAKDIKQAEQLAAMGKLNEIIGKRSANVTGEATIEVQSTSQQLNTPYSRRNAAHGEGGAEISRDEIPATVETYVQQYFEQVRKSAPPSK